VTLWEDNIMSKIEKQFGFYPNRLDVETDSIRISTLPELGERVDSVLSSKGIYQNWIYPLQGPSGIRIFSLPKTHVFEHSEATGEDHVVFHIWALSFFLGMRLTATGAKCTLISALRNYALHEALYVGEPLGFAIHGYDEGISITSEMSKLICRLLVALLGGKDSTYLGSPVNTRDYHSLSLG